MVRPTRHSAPRGAARVDTSLRRARSDAPDHATPTIFRLLIPVGVAAPTAFAFLPALRNGFVNWDDDKILLENEHLRDLGWPNLHWMFTTYRLGHYHPLTWLSLAIDARIWGLTERSAFGFHLTNVVLHAVNAVWVYLLARRLLSLVANADHPADHRRLSVVAALTALLFGLHPLRVESVAWITERRDVLSAFFLLPCVLAYLRYAHGDRWGWAWYELSVLLLALSLLCKAWGITLPVVLLLLDWYPLRRWSRPAALRLTLEKVPFAALAAWAGYHAVLAQSSAAYTMKTLAEYGWLARAAQGFYGVAFYLWKTLIPNGLIPIYEIPRAMNPLSPRFLAAAALVSAITLLVLAYRRRWPAGLALWACYVVVVSPVLGLTQSGPQLVADRYSYLSCLPWALLVGAAVLRWTTRPVWRIPATVLAIAALAGLAGLTWRQTQVWRDSVTLWEHTVRIAPRTYHAHQNLGVALQQRGEMARAEQHYRTALDINPDGADALANLGGLLSDRGHYAEALPLLERALAINAHQPRTWLNLAITLEHLGRHAEAERHYRQGLQMEAPTAQRAPVCRARGHTRQTGAADRGDRVLPKGHYARAGRRPGVLQPGAGPPTGGTTRRRSRRTPDGHSTRAAYPSGQPGGPRPHPRRRRSSRARPNPRPTRRTGAGALLLPTHSRIGTWRAACSSSPAAADGIQHHFADEPPRSIPWNGPTVSPPPPAIPRTSSSNRSTAAR